MKDIYQNYDAVQLAADEDFIRWVRRGTPEEDAAWETWLDRHTGMRAEVEAARSLVRGIHFQVDRPGVDTDRLWERIQTSSREPAVVKPIGGRRRFLFGIAGAVAAAVALVLFFIFGLDAATSIDTGIDEHLAVTLPDQSRVELNSVSRLSFDDTGRQIEMEGEAYFEVQKGSTFSVETPLGTVQVLGTRFNVYSRGDVFRVKCTEGRVRVTAPTDTDGVELSPGMACALNEAGRLITENLSGADAEIGWIEDFYHFREQPLREVFEEMERQFDVRINADEAILSLPHTGFFEGARLDSALYQVTYTRGLNYSIEGNEVSITQADTE